VDRVEVLETHISWVVLTGAYAYKIKKPVSLGFLDFSTLEDRHFYCARELALNRRLAPDLYLEVVPINGPPSTPRVGGGGPVIDYAVKMRQFGQDQLASNLIEKNALGPDLVAGLARKIALFHENAPRLSGNGRTGSPEAVLHHALQNFEQTIALLTDPRDRADLNNLLHWTQSEHQRLLPLFTERHRAGMVRSCHGDLHAGNIALVDGVLLPFDCIEFNDELRCGDVISEVAFMVMDLIERGRAALAHLFLNTYLEVTGDYAGLQVLRFYLVYRALVRAKVDLIRAGQTQVRPEERRRLLTSFRRHATLAAELSRRATPVLILMHGLAGSGKSRVSAELMCALGAVRVRSDVERKRLQGLGSLAPTGSTLNRGAYSAAATRATYQRLATAAREVLDAGYTAILDATFLQRWQRDMLCALAEASGVRAALVSVDALEETLRARIGQRAAAGGDPSEATVGVLDRQLTTHDPLQQAERFQRVQVDSDLPITPLTAQQIIKTLGLIAA